jgi:phosphatidylglycerophosphatase A
MNIDRFCKNIATFGPIGYLPASGTIASIVTALLLMIIQPLLPVTILFILFFVLVSIYIIYRAKNNFAHSDPSQIVLDEAVGCAIAQFGLSSTPLLILSLLLFRFFDIFKRPLIWRLEYLHGPIGIVADDMLAGFFSLLLIRLIMYFI